MNGSGGDQPPVDTGGGQPQQQQQQNFEQQPSLGVATTTLPREQAISTAITFLQHQSVKRTSIGQKQQFLRSKGLTEDEIQIACERAGCFGVDPNAPAGGGSTYINMGISAASPPPPTNSTLSSLLFGSGGGAMTTLQKIREILTSTALLAGITYAIYLFYKNYIRPFLFGNNDGGGGSNGGGRKKKPQRTPEEHMEEISRTMDKNITTITRELVQIKQEVSMLTNNHSIDRQLANFKSDLDAIKGLLLNRKQFSSPVLPPSIPVWQLQSQQTQVDIDKHDDAGSGSGSSETEVVTKNSDSSLELIS